MALHLSLFSIAHRHTGRRSVFDTEANRVSSATSVSRQHDRPHHGCSFLSAATRPVSSVMCMSSWEDSCRLLPLQSDKNFQQEQDSMSSVSTTFLGINPVTRRDPSTKLRGVEDKEQREASTRRVTEANTTLDMTELLCEMRLLHRFSVKFSYDEIVKIFSETDLTTRSLRACMIY